ncbi:myotubularin-related protein 3-like [Physella acuta]|uniref:myotubularin-related protein 3-like n=1 Tax=Physella acuta TaxID=109671 RepID=UPI0027DCA3EB|nr:myotubularin-related protein 3-like [Physella acuta]
MWFYVADGSRHMVMAGDRMADSLQVPDFKRSNPAAQLPSLPLLIGEFPLLVSKTSDGNAMVTNFRFCVCERRSFINVPVMMVSEVFVIEAAKRLRIGCKDGSTYSCVFASSEDCSECTSLLRERSGLPSSTKTLFAYRFYSQACLREGSKVKLTPEEEEQVALCRPTGEVFTYSFDKEVERLGFDTYRKKIWRISHANDNFEFCPTYPKTHILPATYEDDKLKFSLDFRAMRRFPSVVWRDKTTGVVLIRSSQPLSSFLGLSYFHNPSDVSLIEEIVSACNKERDAIAAERHAQVRHATKAVQERGDNCNSNSAEEDGAQGSLVSLDSGISSSHGASNGSHDFDDTRTPRKLAIVDCRSLAGVWGNSFKGGGTEDEVVYKCNIIHLDLANIHTVRDSFNKLRALCHSYVEGTYYKNLSGCMWLTYISALLRGANIVVDLMHVKTRPVLVHCSDGWDRTSQIVSLSEIMMDPYYRTIKGFQVVVEREWLHFGHKFGERGGHDPQCSDTNQVSPIFLQFLDCVYQLTLQYPTEFQFNEAYLVKLLKHSQACLFGDFLHNCQKEREKCGPTASVWSLLRPENVQFLNLLYKPSSTKVLTARYSEHDIQLWKNVYMADLSPGRQVDFYLDSSMPGEESVQGDGVPRSKSMDDLSKGFTDSGRRNSDPTVIQSLDSATPNPALVGVHDTSSSSAEILHFPEDSPNSRQKLLPHQEVGGEKLRPPDCRPAASPPTEASSLAASHSPPTETSSLKDLANSALSRYASLGERPSGPVCPDGPSGPPVCPDGLSCEYSGTEAWNKNQFQTLGPSSSAVAQGLGPSSSAVAQGLGPSSSAVAQGLGPSSSAVAQSLGPSLSTVVLGPSSSAVFCQESSSESSSEQTLCCDLTPDPTSDINCGLSLNSLPNGLNSEHLTNGHGEDNFLTSAKLIVDEDVTLPLKAVTNYQSLDSGYQLRQTSLLSERLTMNGQCLMNGHCQQLANTSWCVNGDKQHSKKSQGRLEDFNEDNHLHQEKDFNEFGVISLTNGKFGKPLMRSIHSNSSPSDLYLEESDRTNVNSLSTDTLTDELETGGGDSSPSSSCYSRPLEVSTKQERLTPPLASSSLVTSRGPAELSDSGTKLVSRRARAASGASRDLSVSPCACRGNWSDTNRLKHPSGGDVSRRWLGATVATSTTDISDSWVAKVSSPACDRQQSIKHHIDLDGLTMFCDERQQLIGELLAERDRKISELQLQLDNAKRTIKSSQPLTTRSQLDDFMSDSEAGEMSSLGSHPASDASWENVDENEAKIVLWVPDSAVTHCAGCDGIFWIGRRKHHCRNCGKVFCADCSNFLAPVPHQHLNKPERVCRKCHSHLLQLSPGASSDGRIPTLVAEG